jgi:hypothetical protein
MLPPGSWAVLAAILNIIQHSDNFQLCKGHLHLTASSNLTMYSVLHPTSDNFQIRKGHAAPDRQQQPDLVQHAAARQRGRTRRHTQHYPAFRQLSGM